MTASVGATILGSPRSSKRTSPGPWRTAPRIVYLPYFSASTVLATKWWRALRALSSVRGAATRMGRSPASCRDPPVAKDVWSIDPLRPVCRLHFLNRDGDRLLGAVQDRDDVLDDSLRQPGLLLF